MNFSLCLWNKAQVAPWLFSLSDNKKSYDHSGFGTIIKAWIWYLERPISLQSKRPTAFKIRAIPSPPGGSSVQFSCLVVSDSLDPMNHSTPGLSVHHQLPEFTQTHVHRVSDAIQPSHPLSSPSPPAPNPSQHQSLFQWVNSLHEVAKVLEFQL